jgi:hypothetical protein
MKKKLKDIKVGDTVWVYGSEEVEKYTVTYIDEFDFQSPHTLYNIGYDYFGTKPKSYYDSVQASGRLESTSTSFGRYAATVYFNKEDVVERFNKDLERLERRKQKFIEDNDLNN